MRDHWAGYKSAMRQSNRFLTVISCLITTVANAELRIPSVFADHMVLQQGGPLPVWGWAEPGEQVTVAVEGKSATAFASGDGRWRVELPALTVGGPYELTVTAGSETRTFRDVLVGEVWLCSGQSNMEWSLWNTEGGMDVIRGEHSDKIRVMQVERWSFDELQDDVVGTWSRSTDESLGGFSAVAYFMGMKLHADLGVPVGLIHTSFGGSPAEAWMPIETLAASPEFRPLVDRANAKAAEFEPTLEAWRAEKTAAEAAGLTPPPEPQGPFGWRNGYKPGGLWNAMLRPLAPFRVRGAVWYQGESNVWLSVQYRTLLAAMIADWREAWDQPELAFGIVQLANFADPRFPPDRWSWPELREAQQIVADNDPHAGMVVTIDCGNPTDIHPRDKRTVGERLARWALGEVYHLDIVTSGPIYRGMEIQGDRVVLRFDHVGSGLTTRDGQPPRGFAVAASPEWWTWGSAEIVGDTVVVHGDWISNPVAVRYAWSDNPQWANLMNKDGLPAAPFRTDTWPDVTKENR